jgi:putative tryptophan/tyrosine transport system substrate-binding protein
MSQNGMLVTFTSEDPEGQARVKAFAETLQKLGVAEGSNVLIETRFASDDANLYHRYSEELVALALDVLLASTSPSRPLRGYRRASRGSFPVSGSLSISW